MYLKYLFCSDQRQGRFHKLYSMFLGNGHEFNSFLNTAFLLPLAGACIPRLSIRCGNWVDCNCMDTCRNLALNVLMASWQTFSSLSGIEPGVIDFQERTSNFPFQAECQILAGHKCLRWKKSKAQTRLSTRAALWDRHAGQDVSVSLVPAGVIAQILPYSLLRAW